MLSVQELIKEDANRALSARLAEWNAKGGMLRRNAPRKTYRIATSGWWIGLFADSESSVPPGDVEIHSELNDIAQPGYRGTKTTLIDRTPSVTSARVVRDRENTRMRAGSVFAEIRYQDDSGPQTFLVSQNEVSIGRGGEDQWVDLALYTTDQISREHLRLRRDPSSRRVQDHGPQPEWNLAQRPPPGPECRGPAAGTGRNLAGGNIEALVRGPP